ncbi:nuclear transport factor 2 family protein [Streptomyces sp. NPDC003952]
MSTPVQSEHAHAAVLRTLYADLTRVGEFAAPDVVYHLAHRDLGPTQTGAGAAATGGPPGRLHGRQAAIDCETALHQATGGTLTAAIDAITANDFFGTVIGTFHAQVNGERLTFPFCGLWRFHEGRIVEHWQNAHNPALVHERLTASTVC